ncbi:hypothetical protein PPACK8108_LOCUS14123 [Phakopsora pachyrhizi]|uniref:PCI domain-containing protein n=1 Tax=Phakopsora pachyrhizi TaxID=170000 RepID=A0AAV0B6W0_PHAPC|nr:hypothetical protein PPACK8108_LOCUS14123 [Phakopsora pachyrhizi]
MADLYDLDHIKLGPDPNQHQSSSSEQSKDSLGSKDRLKTVNRLSAFNKTNHRLEYYLTLIRSSKPGIGLIKLIEDLLSSSGVYVFSEILESKPLVASSENPDHAIYRELLKIFAYGTWSQYRDRQDGLPALNQAQTKKLKQLTVASRASQSKIIPYSELLESLEISTVQELEELIIDAIYSDLLEGKLDQKRQILEVDSFMGRDVELIFENEDLEMDSGGVLKRKGGTNVLELRDRLQNWFDNVGGVIDQLDQYIQSIKTSELESEKLQQKKNDEIRETLEDLALSCTNPQRNQRSKDHKKISPGDHQQLKPSESNQSVA